MTSTEKATPQNLRKQLDEAALKEISANLVKAFDDLKAVFVLANQRQKDAREVAAMFELYHQTRDLDARQADMSTAEREARQEEIRARLKAAIEGYSVVYLAKLATFGGWLADAAGKEWRERP